MADENKVEMPVRPTGMELIYIYPCPHCGREVPFISPTRPDRARCDACRRTFPIVPVDERSNRYVKLMMANGHAAVDPDFM
jgi:DNA-directed RNA polymerase subunit RPC12/RpoP